MAKDSLHCNYQLYRFTSSGIIDQQSNEIQAFRHSLVFKAIFAVIRVERILNSAAKTHINRVNAWTLFAMK